MTSVAVLGAGIMGASTALHLAARGATVTVFDKAEAPFTGASRWNEGKIHLGFLYAADPTMRTAEAVLAGGLDFRDQVERLTGSPLGPVTAPADDHYLVHRESVVSAEATAAYFDAVAAMVAAAPGADRYLVDVSGCRSHPLSSAELAAIADPDVVVAGFRVPERSVDTNAVADGFVAALEAADLDLALGRRVTSVEPIRPERDRWVVEADGRHGPFDAVVNALWEGRPAVDATIGHAPDVAHQHRYRMSVFLRTGRPVDSPCAVLSVGPFGDVKNYNGRDFYLSWYPAGLLARSETVEAPPVPALAEGEREARIAQVFSELSARLPWVADIEAATDEVRFEGGWVYAEGRGRLDDPRATVHRRDLLGVTSVGSYYSVDTGKYSVAPTVAEQIARSITGRD